MRAPAWWRGAILPVLGTGLGLVWTSAALANTAPEDRTDAANDRSVTDVENPQIGRFPDDAIVRTGTFPGSLAIPGTGASVRLGGFVRADVTSDLDGLGFPDVVSNRTIPLDGESGDRRGQTNFSARSSRINFDVRAETRLGPVRGFIEADFLGAGSSLSSRYAFQLRHAAAQVGNLYVGQWWSSFVDVAALPEAANAPLGSPTLRQPGVHYAANLGRSGWRMGIGAENPAGDLSGSTSVPLASEVIPDLTGYVQLRQTVLRVRAAGLLRRLETASDDAWVGGVNLSGRVRLPFLGPRDSVSFQGQFGTGFARYYLSFVGAGLDGFVKPDGSIAATEVLAGYVALQHWWSARWRSTAAVSALRFGLDALAPDGSFRAGEFYSANLFWSPVDRTTFGVDVIYATRETARGDRGSGLRVHATARVDFWAGP